MKLKKLLGLAGIVASLLIFVGGNLFAANRLVVGDVEGFAGDSVTVRVFYTSNEAYNGAEIVLNYDQTKLMANGNSVVVNPIAWSADAPQVTVDPASGEVKVAILSFSDLEARITGVSASTELFSIKFRLDDAVDPGTETISPTGFFSLVDSQGIPSQVDVTSLQDGSLEVLSKFRISADSVELSTGSSVWVPIYLSNAEDVVSFEFELNFNASQLALVSTDSVEINTDIWQNGAPNAPEVTLSSGMVKIGVFSVTGGSVTASVTRQWVARVKMTSVSGAAETDSNPLTFTNPLAVTVDETFQTIENVPATIAGNVSILGKYSLTVGNGAASTGGSDTVDVYLKNADDIVGYEMNLTYDASKFSVSEADVMVNADAFSGNTSSVQTEVSVSSGSVSVTAFPLDTETQIIGSEENKMVARVVVHVLDNAVSGVDSIDASGLVTIRNEDFTTEAETIGKVTKGAFDILEGFELTVGNASGLAGSTQSLPVNLTNIEDVAGAEIVIRFNADSLSYVAGSVQIVESAWGSAPTVDVFAGDDSVAIQIYDLTGQAKVVANPNGQSIFTLQLTASDGLLSGDRASVGIEGLVSTIDDQFNITPRTAAGNPGYFEIVSVNPAPDSVRNVAASISDAGISLTWELPSDSDLSHLIVTRSSGGSVDTVYNSLGSEIATNYLDSDYMDGVEYTYTFQVFDTAGSGSALTMAGPFSHTRVTPGAVTELMAEAGDAVVSLSWMNPADVADGVVDYVQVTRIEGTDTTVVLSGMGMSEQPTSYEDTDVVNGTTYTYSVYVVDTDGDMSEAAMVEATPMAEVVVPVDTTGMLSISSSAGRPGASVMVTVSGQADSAAIAGVSFTVNFDPAALQVESATVSEGLAFTLVGLDMAAANTSGALVVSLVDFSFSSPIPMGTLADMLDITFMIQDGAAGELPLTLSDGSMSDPDAQDIVIALHDGSITVAEAVVALTDGSAVPGATATLSVLTSATKAIAGASFTVGFDISKLQITAVAAGANASAMTPVGVDMAAANTSGELKVSLVDFTFSTPVPAGDGQEIYMVTFQVAADADTGQVIPVTLSDVSLSDSEAQDIFAGAIDGSIRVLGEPVGPVGPKPDINGDGVLNSRDLWAYMNATTPVSFDDLAALLDSLIAMPVPDALLASAKSATSVAGEGAAIVGLGTDYAITLARFTFSYDQSYRIDEVTLSDKAPGTAMIKVFELGGQLVVDVINLGHDLVPANFGDDLLRISFVNGSFEDARLKLDMVQIHDTEGLTTVVSDAGQVGAQIVLPKAFNLAQNSPNPFNPSTTIAYELPEGSSSTHVVLTVFNIRGQKVVTLVDELKEAGRYSVNWNGTTSSGSRVSSGVYFYRIQAGEYSAVRKMVVLK